MRARASSFLLVSTTRAKEREAGDGKKACAEFGYVRELGAWEWGTAGRRDVRSEVVVAFRAIFGLQSIYS